MTLAPTAKQGPRLIGEKRDNWSWNRIWNQIYELIIKSIYLSI